MFRIIFSVRPSGDDSGPKPCSDEPGAPPGEDCAQATLPGGIDALAFRMLADSPETKATMVYFSYGASDVSLTVNPSEDATASAPVTSKELLAAVGDSRFLDLVRYADENPMEEKQISVEGG